MPQITLLVLFKEKLEKRKSRRLSKQVRLRNSHVAGVFANDGVRSLEAQPGGRGRWVESTYGPVSMVPQRPPPPLPSLVPDVWPVTGWPETPHTESGASPVALSPTPGTLMPDNVTISGVPYYQQTDVVAPPVPAFHPTPPPEDWITHDFTTNHRPAPPAPAIAFPPTPAAPAIWSDATTHDSKPIEASPPPMTMLVPNRLADSSWSIASVPDSPESPATPPMPVTPATPATPATSLSLKNPFKRRPKQKPVVAPVASDSDDDDAYSWSAGGKSKKSDWGHW